ncbi:hypothetical protein OF001_U190036 [Pseudomonas sp. OF001]|nr:hypothetical protein OF001_U190036 [Pseudomonas sp. OF001]
MARGPHSHWHAQKPAHHQIYRINIRMDLQARQYDYRALRRL